MRMDDDDNNDGLVSYYKNDLLSRIVCVCVCYVGLLFTQLLVSVSFSLFRSRCSSSLSLPLSYISRTQQWFHLDIIIMYENLLVV